MIEYLWPTPIFMNKAPFTEAEIKSLAEFAKSENTLFKQNPISHDLVDAGVPIRYQFNLLSEPYNSRAPKNEWNKLQSYIDTTYREYLTEAYGVKNASEIKYVARILPVHYNTPNQRTMPHYHHTCDHVMCIYLEVGKNRTPYAERDIRVGDGELILCDPRPMASFPFWEKTRQFETQPGLCIMHPSRLWHETNPFTSDGDRVLLAITLRVVSHNYNDLYKEMHV